MKQIIKEIDILDDRGFTPISDLNYALENGIEYYIGYRGKDAAIVALIPEDESIYFIDKDSMRIMSYTAKIMGINRLTFYTNYGIELHSKHETPSCVGMDRIIKIDKDGFNFKA